MILKIFANARQFDERLNVVFVQDLRRTDARELQ